MQPLLQPQPPSPPPFTWPPTSLTIHQNLTLQTRLPATVVQFCSSVPSSWMDCIFKRKKKKGFLPTKTFSAAHFAQIYVHSIYFFHSAFQPLCFCAGQLFSVLLLPFNSVKKKKKYSVPLPQWTSLPNILRLVLKLPICVLPPRQCFAEEAVNCCINRTRTFFFWREEGLPKKIKKNPCSSFLMNNSAVTVWRRKVTQHAKVFFYSSV